MTAATTLDPLSDVLRSVRLRGAVFFHASCRALWAVWAPPAKTAAPALEFNAEHLMCYHLFVKGSAWIAVDGESPLQVHEGDVIMLPHGDEHMISSAPGVTDAPDGRWVLDKMTPGKPLSLTFCGGLLEMGQMPRDEASTIMVCGFIACDLRPFNPLVSALPRLLHLPAAGLGAWVGPVLEQAVAESGAQRAGSAALLQRLSEMVFVDGARRYVDALPPESKGWLGALRDRHVGRAIGLLHSDPAQAWTLEELGQRVGLSRSALHERFVALTGLAPMQYLANWRMQCGARMLRETPASVATIALDVGYDSEAAFSRAFKRATGLPPGAWRRAQAGVRTREAS